MSIAVRQVRKKVKTYYYLHNLTFTHYMYIFNHDKSFIFLPDACIQMS